MNVAACIEAASAAVAAGVSAAFPFVGGGAETRSLLDEEATLAIELVLADTRGLGKIGLGACEGPRDGARVIRVADDPAEIYVYCDPIDGTLNAACGGPRAHSVVAFTSAGTSSGRRSVSDGQSIFAIGSHSADVSAVFDRPGRWRDLIAQHARDVTVTTAILNREDNFAMLRTLAGALVKRFVVGSTSGYRPSLAGDGWIAVGDATITLPFECDLEFGRIGAVEAQIQSALYASWTGLVVSRDRIRESPDGLCGYLDRYLFARATDDTNLLTTLFTEEELEWFRADGQELLDATAPLTPDCFGIGRDAVVAIAALSSSEDRLLGSSIEVVGDPIWDPERGVLDVDVLLVAGQSINRCRRSVPVEGNSALSPVVQQGYRSRHGLCTEEQC
ncbi:hypothetical protein [Nocardia gamkensis]|uniref:hypothetical protein n=1 Tax=Nocardia gamkensis TaxID=352869 RepID=UPI0037C53EB4